MRCEPRAVLWIRNRDVRCSFDAPKTPLPVDHFCFSIALFRRRRLIFYSKFGLLFARPHAAHRMFAANGGNKLLFILRSFWIGFFPFGYFCGEPNYYCCFFSFRNRTHDSRWPADTNSCAQITLNCTHFVLFQTFRRPNGGSQYEAIFSNWFCV